MFIKKKNGRYWRSGFTLLEIMAVVVIMGLLVAAVAVSVRGYISTARKKVVLMDLRQIEAAIEIFQGEQGRYPTDEEGLEVLTGSDKANGSDSKILSLKDPWKNEYEYQRTSDETGESFLVICYGADGMVGGTGINADITHLDTR